MPVVYIRLHLSLKGLHSKQLKSHFHLKLLLLEQRKLHFQEFQECQKKQQQIGLTKTKTKLIMLIMANMDTSRLQLF